ncbi:uncharacterized protein LOC128214994 [Mya arenaria]|uniref:uncharacterized protein LOC128214994 n=1 Tax=Mya arenaria TaxID=6604 RepID=UPI0022E64B19|nr:uncharacterized protein LOC128214994 [Mya arenaria]
MDLLRRCFIVVLCVTAVNAHVQCPKGNNEMPGGEIGLPFPPDKCAVPTEDFLKYVVNRVYVSAYVIDTLRLTSAISTQRRFTVQPDASIVSTFAYAAGDSCQSFDVIYPGIRDDIAVFPEPENRDFRVLSCSPAEYLITYHCRDVTEIVCGKCPRIAVLIYVRDRREDKDGDGIPDGDPDFTDVPWGEIEKFSKHCLGEDFENDDLLGWKWKGRSQPENCTLLSA